MTNCDWSYGTWNDRFHCAQGEVDVERPCSQEDKVTCPIWLAKGPVEPSTPEVTVEDDETS